MDIGYVMGAMLGMVLNVILVWCVWKLISKLISVCSRNKG